MKNVKWKANLRAMRKAAGLSQQELAERSGVLQSRISEYERGGRLITNDHRLAFAAVLGPVDTGEVGLSCAGLEMSAVGWFRAIGVMRILRRSGLKPSGAWFPFNFGLWDVSVQEVMEVPKNYIPTPAVSPWNKGSGFTESTSNQAMEMIEKSGAWPEFSATIKAARKVAERDLDKRDCVRVLRNTLPDDAIDWVDACVFEDAHEQLQFPVPLGTGGNEARLDYSRAFHGALAEAYDLETGRPTPAGLTGWYGMLSGEHFAEKKLTDKSLGMYGTFRNPWDVIAIMEGAIAVGPGIRQRLRAPWYQAHGITVPSPSAVSPAVESDAPRAELWLPLWEEPSTYEALRDWVQDYWGGKHPTTPVHAAIKAQHAKADGILRAGVYQRNGQSYTLVNL